MHQKGLKSKAVEAIVLVLVLAFAAHLVWSWLQALVPGLIAVLVLAVVYAVLLGRLRR